MVTSSPTTRERVESLACCLGPHSRCPHPQATRAKTNRMALTVPNLPRKRGWMSTRFPADPSKEDSPRIKHATCSEGSSEQVVKPLSPQHLGRPVIPRISNSTLITDDNFPPTPAQRWPRLVLRPQTWCISRSWSVREMMPKMRREDHPCNIRRKLEKKPNI